MNLKERGITVGDLLILIVVLISSTILIKSFNKEKKTTLYDRNQDKISYQKIYYKKIDSKFIYR